VLGVVAVGDWLLVRERDERLAATPGGGGARGVVLVGEREEEDAEATRTREEQEQVVQGVVVVVVDGVLRARGGDERTSLVLPRHKPNPTFDNVLYLSCHLLLPDFGSGRLGTIRCDHKPKNQQQQQRTNRRTKSKRSKKRKKRKKRR
jgi:hypothetical protein